MGALIVLRRRSRGVSEVVSSVTMLAITVAVLGGVGLISIGSLRSANAVLLSGSQNAENEAGVLLSLVSTQGNSSGTYVWIFNYGWAEGRITSVYLNGGIESGWKSTCGALRPEQLCFVELPPATTGSLVVEFGARTISISL